MKKRKILKTERLILRPFKSSDARSVQLKAGKKEIAKTTLNIPHPYPNGAAEEWIASHRLKFESGESIPYAITLKGTGELVGAAELTVTKRFNHAELGYWIDTDHWGEGYATEAARALLDYGFTAQRLHKIFAVHMTNNPASGGVMKKLGMKKEGVLKKHILKSHRYEDIVMYGMLKTEWNKTAA